MLNISDLIGKTMVYADISEDELILIDENNIKYRLGHVQDCCEDVHIAEIHGDLKYLRNTQIIHAELIEENEYIDENGELSGYSFYKFRTEKGYLTIRWNGASNGYYSISVSLVIID